MRKKFDIVPHVMLISIFILINLFAVMQEYPKINRELKKYKQSSLLEKIKNEAQRLIFDQTEHQADTRLGVYTAHNEESLISTREPIFDTKNKIEIGLLNQPKNYFLRFRLSVNSGKRFLAHFQSRLEKYITSSLLDFYSLPQAAVFLGFVFGQDELVSASMRHDLKITGMSHIMSASGYNIGLILGLAQPVICRFCSRRRSFWFFCLVMWCYVWLAGASASLYRAALMASLGYYGHKWLFFQISPLRLLAISFVVLFLLSPQLATSLSFQLSAAATAGLVLLLPLLRVEGRLSALLIGAGISPESTPGSIGKRILSLLEESFFTTLMAQAFTVPLIWYHFQEFSLVSFAANPALLWITPIITIFGLITTGVVLLLSAVHLEVFIKPLAWFGWSLVGILQHGLAFFGQFERGFWQLPELPFGGVLAWWFGLFLLSLYLKSRQKSAIQREVDVLHAW